MLNTTTTTVKTTPNVTYSHEAFALVYTGSGKPTGARLREKQTLDYIGSRRTVVYRSNAVVMATAGLFEPMCTVLLYNCFATLAWH